jgi:hypothetical protein
MEELIAREMDTSQSGERHDQHKPISEWRGWWLAMYSLISYSLPTMHFISLTLALWLLTTYMLNTRAAKL